MASVKAPPQAFTWFCTLGGYLGVGFARDFFRMPTYVKDSNDDEAYMKDLTERMRRSTKVISHFNVKLGTNVFNPLTNEDFEEMTKSASEEEEEEQPEETYEEIEEPGLTLERLEAMYKYMKAAQHLSQKHDDNMVRSVTFCYLLDDSMIPYTTILQQKKKQRQQLPITMFFSCKKQP
ncbi:hypothetical protein SK128_023654 [Halocaridina rubra]|uniref:Uncharacterized protein n=1 Tax=Halocaridina rubra TaxID=373956 RepID=A0AAN9A2F4_HALRR